mgnify:CR=1 FL=1
MGFLKKDGKSVDVELVVMQSLAQLSSQKSGAVNRPMAERTAALAALKSYKGSENYAPIADRVVTALKAEIAASTDALQRQAVRDLLDGFTKQDADAAK